MGTESQVEPRKFRRTANACLACRQSKIKCSGEEPCTNCQRRAIQCRFSDGGNKVTVTESYLKGLQQRAREKELSPGSKRSAEDAFGGVEVGIDVQSQEDAFPQPTQPPTIDPARNIWTSPFTLPSRIIKNTYKNKRNWIWLAPTSLWSFTARLTLMMTDKLEIRVPYASPNLLDRDIYPLQWKPIADEEPLDATGLPSMDHALYLFNTVKFHLGEKYLFFEDETFVEHMHDFYYGNAVKKASECRLWFIQFLLVLAFGNAFLQQSRSSGDPPGSKFFVRAMSLMPDLASLWKDSLLAIEVLALAGLYLYSIDHRESAHVYLGQAIRIAQLEGLHTELPEDELGIATVTRCRRLWWTLYIMDRHFSSSIGLPMSTPDSDITALIDPPSALGQRDATLSLQVKLSHLLSTILASIYRTEKTQLGTFLEKTRSILHRMAGHAQEIERLTNVNAQNSIHSMPKGTRHVTLMYHQCVMIATRPLLLSILKERLDNLWHGEEDWQNFLAPTKSLISTGIKSASKMLQILTDDDDLMEIFLPFNLEFTFGAAIHLTMAHTLFPRTAKGRCYSTEAHSILNEMSRKGNKIAATRKAELSHLETLFRELAARMERRGLETLTLSSPELNEPEATHNRQALEESSAHANVVELPSSGDLDSSPSVLEQTAANLELLDNIGISSYDFFALVNQIGNAEDFSVLDPTLPWKPDL
ncbi:Zn(II)2Cys6 transcription factor [Aspergillus avenaceus]|uniref:Zn(II)2Cys6 transcription factor n=1 Tax=Aspergillus avenaceus TaxID=36643 RepID=A0A5N6U323_ASPAV|nr:Zn(II)2Cys6 transcription factor [Aspergillus avenaceus]